MGMGGIEVQWVQAKNSNSPVGFGEGIDGDCKEIPFLSVAGPLSSGQSTLVQSVASDTHVFNLPIFNLKNKRRKLPF